LEIVTALGDDSPPLTSTLRSALVYRVVPSEGTLGGSWTPELEAGTAAWLNGSYVNSVFCLPPDTEATLAELPEGTTVLMRPATGDVREYRIVRVREVGRQQTEVLSQRKAGMTLLACGVLGDRRVVAEAVYLPPITRELPPLAAQGNEVPNYLRAEVEDIDAQPLDGQLVQLNVRVTLENLSSGEVRWTDLTDQLVVAGQAARPLGQPEWAPIAPGETERVTYSYIVPRDTGETVWQVLAPTGEQLDLRFAVPTTFE
jgi:transcription elongation GreA/GreB family factor